MEQSPSNPGGDGDQVALSVEDFDLGGAGHFWEIHGAAAADEGGRFFVGGHARQLWRQFSGMDEKGI